MTRPTTKQVLTYLRDLVLIFALLSIGGFMAPHDASVLEKATTSSR